MNRILEKLQRLIGKATGTTACPACRPESATEQDCCGDEDKRLKFPPTNEFQGTLRSTQVPWLAIR
ncbi:MAG: hypothetical protein JSU61_05255 [Fidelibacterota bacterium]|nr:MAG: hypothetical protein JSU61_05255 [Candidatus Neomarinimicrobiota bacterium]